MAEILSKTEDNIDTENLFGHRTSIELTPDNAHFFPSEGGLISLTIENDKGETESFERVVVLRSFPITDPDEFLSIREPDINERGEEIGIIENINQFDEKTRELLLVELDRRYFVPKIYKINSVKEKFESSYWEVKTSAGDVTFVMRNPFNNIRVLEDGRVFMNDIDGNCFEIPDPKRLDPYSYKKIEVYL